MREKSEVTTRLAHNNNRLCVGQEEEEEERKMLMWRVMIGTKVEKNKKKVFGLEVRLINLGF